MKVKDIMITDVKSVRPDTLVSHALTLLSEYEMSGLPVIDTDNKLVGMFTEKDIIRYILPGYVGQVGSFIYQENPKAIKNKVNELLSESKVSDVMRRDVITVGPDAPLSEVARIILTEKIRRLPVVDNEARVIGIIARQDIVKAFIKGEF